MRYPCPKYLTFMVKYIGLETFDPQTAAVSVISVNIIQVFDEDWIHLQSEI